MLNAKQISVLAITAMLMGCATATDGPGIKTEETSAPRPVDAREDNAAVLAQTSPGLIVTLHVEGSTIRSVETQIASVTATTQAESESISITALSNGDRIATMSVADQRVNVQEEVGIVETETRTLIGTMQLPSRVDTLIVESPALEETKELDVRDVFDAFCEQYRDQSICTEKPR